MPSYKSEDFVSFVSLCFTHFLLLGLEVQFPRLDTWGRAYLSCRHFFAQSHQPWPLLLVRKNTYSGQLRPGVGSVLHSQCDLVKILPPASWPQARAEWPRWALVAGSSEMPGQLCWLCPQLRAGPLCFLPPRQTSSQVSISGPPPPSFPSWAVALGLKEIGLATAASARP